MSSRVSRTSPLHLSVSPSRCLRVILLLFYMGALLLLWLLPLSVWFHLLFSFCLIFDLRKNWSRYASVTHPLAVRKVVWQGEGEWCLWHENGLLIPRQHLLQSVNHPLLTVLNFSCGAHVVLLPDSSDRESLRRLRVRLRLGDGG